MNRLQNDDNILCIPSPTSFFQSFRMLPKYAVKSWQSFCRYIRAVGSDGWQGGCLATWAGTILHHCLQVYTMTWGQSMALDKLKVMQLQKKDLEFLRFCALLLQLSVLYWAPLIWKEVVRLLFIKMKFWALQKNKFAFQEISKTAVPLLVFWVT